MRVQSLGQGDPLEKEMATCPSVLSWATPWTEDPGGLQSVGSQRDKTERLSTHTQPCVRHRAPDFIICFS